MRRILLPLLLTGTWAACASDDPAPTVHVLSATPDQIDPADDLHDDVRIQIEYEDADGDLGEGVAEVHDCRDETLTTMLPIPAIAPADVISDGAKITGSMDLYLTDVGAATAAALPAVCADLGVKALGANETRFCVVLVDQKEHAGPGDCTVTITLAP